MGRFRDPAAPDRLLQRNIRADEVTDDCALRGLLPDLQEEAVERRIRREDRSIGGEVLVRSA